MRAATEVLLGHRVTKIISGDRCIRKETLLHATAASPFPRGADAGNSRVIPHRRCKPAWTVPG
jgi:hypothetical protein